MAFDEAKARQLEDAGHFEQAMKVWIVLERFAEAARVASEIGLHAEAGELSLRAGLYFEAGNSFHVAGDVARAISSFERVRKREPHYAESQSAIQALRSGRGIAALVSSASSRPSPTAHAAAPASRTIEPAPQAVEHPAPAPQQRHKPMMFDDIMAPVSKGEPAAPSVIVEPRSPGGEFDALPRTQAEQDEATGRRTTSVLDFMDSEPESPSDPGETQETRTVFGVAPGETLGGLYRVVEVLGRGNASVVYAAEDLVAAQDVVVKVIEPVESSPAAKDWFERRAAVCHRLMQRNILRVFGIGEHDHHRFIAMERLRGRTLADALRVDGALSIERALAIAVDVARALLHVHELSVVHMDLSARRIFLLDDGTTKVTGFLGAADLSDGRRGPADYAAPEQIEDPDTTRSSSNIYSLGALLFETLTGSLPDIDGPAPSLISAGVLVSSALDDLVSRLLGRRPHERPDSAASVLKAMERMMTVE